MTTQKTWLITGASSGLGRALTEQALAAGHRVVATTRRGSLPVQHECLAVLQMDPADREQCRQVVEEAQELFGGLDIVVNNAGYGLVDRKSTL